MTSVLSENDVVKEGYCEKKGGKQRKWLRRWFVLTKDRKLVYYDSEEVIVIDLLTSSLLFS